MPETRSSNWSLDNWIPVTFTFDEGGKRLVTGNILWASHDIRAMLVDVVSSPIPGDTDLTSYLRIGTDAVVAGKSVNKNTVSHVIEFIGLNPSWAGVGAGEDVGAIIFYKFVTNDSNSIPIFCLEALGGFTSDGNSIVGNLVGGVAGKIS